MRILQRVPSAILAGLLVLGACAEPTSSPNGLIAPKRPTRYDLIPNSSIVWNPPASIVAGTSLAGLLNATMAGGTQPSYYIMDVTSGLLTEIGETTVLACSTTPYSLVVVFNLIISGQQQYGDFAERSLTVTPAKKNDKCGSTGSSNNGNGGNNGNNGSNPSNGGTNNGGTSSGGTNNGGTNNGGTNNGGTNNGGTNNGKK